MGCIMKSDLCICLATLLADAIMTASTAAVC